MSCPVHRQANGPESQRRRYTNETSLKFRPISLFLLEPKLLGFQFYCFFLKSHEEENRLPVASVSFFSQSNNIPKLVASPWNSDLSFFRHEKGRKGFCCSCSEGRKSCSYCCERINK
ncbi:hypothetical protein CEXT_57701 [Caerostris extrusa]|uniref:Uncharacterized protein n=1 Tax=Caerostris extrusa TaxID=172846 RepID=A0AAV4VFH7_CAEEX|nr:hypothetical protein CEXT_57701 [Caerostris extrusa]